MKNASCDCKGSARGRYNHVAGLPFDILDWSEKGQQSCTSKLCEWKVGHKAKRPKVLHDSEYASISGKPVEREKKKAVEMMIFDSRTPSLSFPEIHRASITSLATCSWHERRRVLWENHPCSRFY